MPRELAIKIRLNHVSTCLTIATSNLELLVNNFKIPGMEGILNTTQSLLKLAETITQNRNTCNELMEQAHILLNAITGAYINSDTGIEQAPNVLNHIAKFAQTLHKIHTFVEAQQHINKVKRLFRRGEMSALLKKCKAELQQELEFFQVITLG
ncbi:hypothetical protein B0H16DRAFT_1454917 [Mycena metata]|uniref:Uncharacterized protein n=1 Tax=Mycena metata TaxID=1033252 RepID=A0AAD7NK90_9AGAR|nr:hypothetical protein B0H16DRAFT_1454917 [Mycena metata]